MLNRIISFIMRRGFSYGEKAYKALDSAIKEIILEDLARVESFMLGEELQVLKKVLETNASFRSIMSFRIEKSGNEKAIRHFRIFSLFYPPAPGIELNGEFGGGLRIVHRCCVASVKKAGKNLSLGPFVVVGKKHGELPLIGDNVTICANSTVVGDIRIGDNALIGASSFVDKDVSADTWVCGNPAALLKNSHLQSEKRS